MSFKAACRIEMRGSKLQLNQDEKLLIIMDTTLLWFQPRKEVTYDQLKHQCKYGLIKTNPVPRDTKKWNRLLRSKGTLTTNWRSSHIFNVICGHSDCSESTSWEDRSYFKSFRSKHWWTKHPNDADMKCKVVSFWSTEKVNDKTKVVTEYRLVDDDLEYIKPAADSLVNDHGNPPIMSSVNTESTDSSVGTKRTAEPFNEPTHKKRKLNQETSQSVVALMKMTRQIGAQCHELRDRFGLRNVNEMSAEQLSNAALKFEKWKSEFNKLSTEMTRCHDVVAAITKEFAAVQPDNAKYDVWTMREVGLWLMSLESGRFKKYIPRLIVGFKSDHIKASNLPDLDRGDLRVFGVQDFRDRNDLKRHLNSLRSPIGNIEMKYAQYP